MSIERLPITNRAEWLAWRTEDLTASDIAAAAGLDPHKSALRLYAEKTGMLMSGADNKMMRRGRWLEPAVIEALHDEHPDWRIIQPRVYLRDTELRLGATPDALAVLEDIPDHLINVQCKVVSRPVYERDWTDGPPAPYALQTLTEGMLLDAAESYVAALIIDTYSAELELWPVPRHPGAEDRVKRIARTFWTNVAAGHRPAADFQRDAETVAELFPQSKPEPVLDLTGDNRAAELLAMRAALKSEVTGCEADLAAIDTELKDKMGTHEVALLPGHWKVIWKSVDYKEYTVPAATRRSLRVIDQREKEQAA